MALTAAPANAAISLFEDFEAATTTTDFGNTIFSQAINTGGNTLDLNGVQGAGQTAGLNTTKTSLMQSSNRAIVLDNALALDTGAYTGLTVAFDYYYQNYTGERGMTLQYSALGDFSDTEDVFKWLGPLVTHQTWNSGSITLTEGTGTGEYIFTDTAKIRFLSGGTANNNHVQLDNISITSGPEPSSTTLIGLGGLALILRRRR